MRRRFQLLQSWCFLLLRLRAMSGCEPLNLRLKL
jgi:hypothetical protein